MLDSFTCHIRAAADSPWLAVPVTALGAVPTGRGTPDLYVVVAKEGVPFRRLDLYGDHDTETYGHEDVLVFGDILGIGFGHHVFLVPLLGDQPRTLQLNSYFLEFRRVDDSIYVVSGEDITRLDLHGDVVWTSPTIAVDGIEIESIEAEFSSGMAEHDPPGGWRAFRIRTSDGVPVVN